MRLCVGCWVFWANARMNRRYTISSYTAKQSDIVCARCVGMLGRWRQKDRRIEVEEMHLSEFSGAAA